MGFLLDVVVKTEGLVLENVALGQNDGNPFQGFGDGNEGLVNVPDLVVVEVHLKFLPVFNDLWEDGRKNQSDDDGADVGFPDGSPEIHQ